MLKLIGQLVGHSFGVMIMVLAVTFGAPPVVPSIYLGGYTLLPFIHILNISLDSRSKRKIRKKIMLEKDFLSDFEYKQGKKVTKKLDKLVLKEQKEKLKDVRSTEASTEN